MATFPLYIIYRDSWFTYICTRCSIGVRRLDLVQHLKNKHQESKALVREVALHVQQQPKVDPQIPYTLKIPDINLILLHNYFTCQLCPRTTSYICQNFTSLRAHLRTAHEIQPESQRGRPQKAIRSNIKPDYWTTTCCQKVFNSGVRHLIQVPCPEHSSDISRTVPSTSRRLLSITQLNAEVTQAKVEAYDSIQTSDHYSDDPWLRHTGWRNYLESHNRTTLLELMQLADQNISTEVDLATTVRDNIEKGQVLVLQCNPLVRQAILQVSQTDQVVGQLQPYQDKKNLSYGIQQWQRILLYFVRCQREVEHPVFILEQRQSRLLLEIEELVNKQDKERAVQLRLKVLEFLIALLDQESRTKHLETPLLSALAVLGLNPQGWKGCEAYPSLLSALIKTARYLTLLSAYEADPKAEENHAPSLAVVQLLVQRFLSCRLSAPFNYLYQLRSYGMHLAFQYSTEGRVSFSGETLTYQDIRLSLSSFRTAVYTLLFDTQHHFETSLLLQQPPPYVNILKLCDLPSCRTTGFSFINHTTNTSIFPMPTTWLGDTIDRQPQLRRQFYQDTKHESIIRRTRVEQYRIEVNQFLKSLAILVHLTAGQPARSPELLSVRYQNSTTGNLRNIFIDNGSVRLVTRYYKGSSIIQNNDVKVVVRFLPFSISQLLVQYIWLVIPWIEALNFHLDQYINIEAFLWPSEGPIQMPRTRFLDMFSRTTQQYLGYKIGIQDYRHIAIAFGRQFLQATEQQGLDSDNNLLEEYSKNEAYDSALDLQAAHSSYVAELRYARGSAQLSSETRSRLQQFRTVSGAWHRLLRLSDHSTSLSTSTTTDDIQESFVRWKKLAELDPRQQLELLFGKGSFFRTIQELIVRAIYQGQSPILSVLPTGGGKSLLFLLPASYDFSGVTIVLLPLISLREDLYRRTKELGILSIIWQPSLTSIDYNIIFATPESLRSNQFWTFLLKLRTMEKLDRIVIDECHLLIQETISYRPILAEIGRLTQLGVRLLFLTATMPPGDEARFWRTIGFVNDTPTHTYRTSTVQNNARYSVQYLAYDNRIKILQSYIYSHTGKVIVFVSQTRTVKELSSLLQCYSYYAGLEGKEEQLSKFRIAENSVIVTTIALSLGVHILDVRHIIHYDLPDTLLDYVQESGRGGRDGLAYTSIVYFLLKYRTKDPSLVRYLSHEEDQLCRRTTIASYLDSMDVQCLTINNQARPDIEPCDRCQTQVQFQPRTATTTTELRMDSQKRQRTISPVQDIEVTLAESRTINEVDNNQPISIADDIINRTTNKDSAWQQQERLREQERRTSTILRMEEAGRQDQILWLLSRISVVCPYCFLILRTTDHAEGQCTRAESRNFRTESSTLRRGVQLAPYSGCYQCWLPQQICNRWRDYEGGSGDSSTTYKNKSCQYPSIVRDCCIWVLARLEVGDNDVGEVIELQYGVG